MPEETCSVEASYFPDTVQRIRYWMGGTSEKMGKDHKKTPGRPRRNHKVRHLRFVHK